MNPYQCKKKGCEKDGEIHHIVPRKLFYPYLEYHKGKKYDMINGKNNRIRLCREHHEEIHTKIFQDERLYQLMISILKKNDIEHPRNNRT